ncbi:hypothetical protein Bbelb_433570 [Branchiostoma belcheri]|nr:hypothetical protein Bbelb_433570 [Branchiostoma belcheri]
MLSELSSEQPPAVRNGLSQFINGRNPSFGSQPADRVCPCAPRNSKQDRNSTGGFPVVKQAVPVYRSRTHTGGTKRFLPITDIFTRYSHTYIRYTCFLTNGVSSRHLQGTWELPAAFGGFYRTARIDPQQIEVASVRQSDALQTNPCVHTLHADLKKKSRDLFNSTMFSDNYLGGSYDRKSQLTPTTPSSPQY